MLEEAAGGKFLREHQSGALVHYRKPAQCLRRVPAEGSKIIKPVGRTDAETFSQRIDVGQKFAEAQHHAFGLGAGSGREQDDRVVLRPRRVFRRAWSVVRNFAKQRTGYRRVIASDRKPWRTGTSQHVIQPQAVLTKNELRLEPIENAGKLIAVHVDMNRADGRARRHDAEIAEQLLN